MLQQLKTFLASRRRAYQVTFGNEAAKTVLEDLAGFCRANESCVVPGDDRATAVLEGRREVWLRIQEHLRLTEEQLWELRKPRG